MTGCFFFQAEDGIRDLVRSRGLGDVYKRQFQGGSALKTWLVGILKHKLIDQLRRHSREATVLDLSLIHI